MSMVSYYNPASAAAMYRHPQSHHQPGHQYHHHNSPPVHPWYQSFNHQHGGQVLPGASTPSYCMQDEQNVWPHPAATAAAAASTAVAGVYHPDIQDYVQQQQQHQQQQHHQQAAVAAAAAAAVNGHHMMTGAGEHHHHHGHHHHESQLPSPPITVSGSEMSSPGGNVSPSAGSGPGGLQQTRPTPVRSPYEWMKKANYQSQPNPGKTRTKDKYRVVYTDHQRVELEKEFYYSRYITIRRKAELASNLGLSERQVKIWFQNRRAKERKQVKKREEFTHKDGVVLPLQQHPPPALIHHHHHHLQQPSSSSSSSQPHHSIIVPPPPVTAVVVNNGATVAGVGVTSSSVSNAVVVAQQQLQQQSGPHVTTCDM